MLDNVMDICSGVFFCCRNLREVKLSSSIMAIREGALCGCGNLNTIKVPDNVKSIGRDAFAANHYYRSYYLTG